MIFFTITGVVFWSLVILMSIVHIWKTKFERSFQKSKFGKSVFYYVTSKKYKLNGADAYRKRMTRLYPYFVLRKHLVRITSEEHVQMIDERRERQAKLYEESTLKQNN